MRFFSVELFLPDQLISADPIDLDWTSIEQISLDDVGHFVDIDVMTSNSEQCRKVLLRL